MTELVLHDRRLMVVCDERDAELVGTIDKHDFQTLVRLNLLIPTRRAKGGQVTEYRFSHTLRTLLNR